MDKISEIYLKHKADLNKIMDPNFYSQSFEYKKNNPHYKDLNFVYIIDKESIKLFEKSIGLFDHEMHLETETKETNNIKNNLLMDTKRMSDFKFSTRYKDLKSLNYIVNEVEEDEMIFLSKEIFEIIHEKFKDFCVIKKVVHLTNDGLKIEIWNPFVNVLFVNNDDVFNQKINLFNYEDFILKIRISNYMSGGNLLSLLKEAAMVEFNISDHNLEDFKILLPESNEINKENLKKLISGELDSKEIKNKNLTDYDIYNERLIFFLFKNKSRNWSLNLKSKKIEQKKQQKVAKCAECDDSVKEFEYICICGDIYCDKYCQRRHHHPCNPKNCGSCEKKLGKIDSFNLKMCFCGVIFCDDDCKLRDSEYHKNCVSSNGMEIEISGDNINNGKIGLGNIGNTCYMNSALQCLLHTDILKEFFLNSDFIEEINYSNPLGTKGNLLKEFSNLFRNYWSTTRDSIRPSTFKRVLSNYLSTFEGYGQHDSQEFLSQLLDQIHEDINRIINKPYTKTVEGKDSDSDSIISRKSWVNFLKRNYSILINNFYGQFKSIVTCPNCQNSSVTFDPYQIISLSIPSVIYQEFEIFYINPDQTEKAVKFSFSAKSLHKFADISLKEIIESFRKKINKKDRLIFTTLGFSIVGEVYKEGDSLMKIYDLKYLRRSKPKIFLYGLNRYEEAVFDGEFSFPIFLKTNYEIFDVEDDVRNTYDFYKKSKEFDENPIFTKIVFSDEQMTVKDLYLLVLRKFLHVTDIKLHKVISEFTLIDFRKVWLKIENDKSLQFFYLKFGDELLDHNSSLKLIDLKKKTNKLVIKVFLKNKEKTSVKTTINEFISCENHSEKPPKFCSEDLSSYKNEYSIYQLLKNFEKPEILDKDNAWYCSKCKKPVQATKKIKIYKLPKYLIINFKKLKNSSKNPPLITFPTKDLNLSDYTISKNSIQNYKIKPEEFYGEKDIEFYKEKNKKLIFEGEESKEINLKYRLYGVINHFGSQHFGHYTASCVYQGDQWGYFNDSSVRDEKEEGVVGEGAYCLFYKRCD